MATILAFGSINVDLVARVPAIARPGETVLSPGYGVLFGGKGANQAVAAARLSPAGAVAFAGAVGDDAFGRDAVANLAANGVDVANVVTSVLPTGCAFIAVQDGGENAITVASAANAALQAADVAEATLAAARVVVLQMETPLDQSLAIATRARAAGASVIWNAAPAPGDLAPVDWRAVLVASDVLVFNEHEALTAAAGLGPSTARFEEAAAAIAQAQGGICVVTAGARGALAVTADGVARWAEAPAIVPVDTTGAGDTFVGALAVGLAEGMPLDAALHLACRAAALACLALGAQTGMPTRADLAKAYG